MARAASSVIAGEALCAIADGVSAGPTSRPKASAIVLVSILPSCDKRSAASWPTRHVRCIAGLSVYPAANNDGSPWCDDRPSDDHRASCGDAACAIDAARADDGARVHRAQGDEASCQQERDHQMFHDCPPWVEVPV